MSDTEDLQKNSVQSLIDRIRDQGVKAAQDEAARLVRDAEAKAAKLLADANAEAERIKAEATAVGQAEHAAGLETLKLSARDTMLQLKAQVSAEFESFVRRLVTDATCDVDLIRSLVLVLAGHAVDEFIQDKNIQILINCSLATGEVDASIRDSSRASILALSTEMLRKGVELIPADGFQGGARVRLVDEQLEIDLSDAAISRMLSERLLPRFRRILEGIE